MKLKQLTAMGTIVLFSAACGSGVAKDSKNVNEEASAEEFTADAVNPLELDSVVEESDMALDQVDDLGSEQAGALALTGSESPKAAAGKGKIHKRSCTVDATAGKTTVSILRGIGKFAGFDTNRLQAVAGRGFIEKIERVWSLAGATVPCDEEAKHVAIDWKQVSGLTLDVSFKRARGGVAGYRAPLKDDSEVAMNGIVAEGNRSIQFNSALSSDSTEIVRDSTVKSNVTRNFKAKGNREVKLQVKTSESAPLVVQAILDAQDHKLKSRTIKSGTLIATRANGAMIEANFENVQFVRGDDCMRPASGTISGKVTLANGESHEFSATMSPEGIDYEGKTPKFLKRRVKHQCDAE
jgi:hypothetical protein